MTFLLGIVLSLAGLFLLVRTLRSRRPAVAWTREEALERYRLIGAEPGLAKEEQRWAEWMDLQRRGRRRRPTYQTEIEAEIGEAARALLVSLEEEIEAESARWVRRPKRPACRDPRLRAAGRPERTRRRPARVAAALRARHGWN